VKAEPIALSLLRIRALVKYRRQESNLHEV